MFTASLPLGQMEGLGLREGLEASTAHIPCAALQGYPLTPMRLPKEHPCLLLHPSGLTHGSICQSSALQGDKDPEGHQRQLLGGLASVAPGRRVRVSGAVLRLPAANT